MIERHVRLRLFARPTPARPRLRYRFFPDIGCALLAYGPQHATLALTLLPRHLNNASTMHGGVMATLRVVA